MPLDDNVKNALDRIEDKLTAGLSFISQRLDFQDKLTAAKEKKDNEIETRLKAVEEWKSGMSGYIAGIVAVCTITSGLAVSLVELYFHATGK